MPRDPYGKRSRPTPKERPAVDPDPTEERCPLCEGKGSVEPLAADLFRETCKLVKEQA